MCAHLRCNLPIGRAVHSLDRNNSRAELVLQQSSLQFSLGLARTQNEERARIANSRNHRVVIDVELSCEHPLTTIVRRHLG